MDAHGARHLEDRVELLGDARRVCLRLDEREAAELRDLGDLLSCSSHDLGELLITNDFVSTSARPQN